MFALVSRGIELGERSRGVPPTDGTRHNPPVLLPKIMVPSLFQDPPTGGPGLSQMSWGRPVVTSIF